MIIYTQVFLAAILYAFAVWAHVINSSCKKLNSFQNTFIKMSLNVPWFLRGRLISLRQEGIPTIEERILGYEDDFHENIDEHENPLVRELVNYPL